MCHLMMVGKNDTTIMSKPYESLQAVAATAVQLCTLKIPLILRANVRCSRKNGSCPALISTKLVAVCWRRCCCQFRSISRWKRR
jgi:hypothetical protein